MKAKSWKKFVKQERTEEDEIAKKKGKRIFDLNEKEIDPLSTAIDQNQTLKELMNERNKLEQKMGELTGEIGSGTFGGISNGALGEIPTHAEKRKIEALREKQRKKGIQSIRAKRTNEKETPSHSNVTSAESPTTGTPQDFLGKITKGKKAVDDFDERHEKIRTKLEAAKRGAKKFKDGYDDAKKELDRFSKESAEFGGSGEIDMIRDRFGTGSKLDKKMDKITDSFNKKRGGEKLDQRWEQLKESKQKLKEVKDKYEARKNKLLKTDGSKLKENDKTRKRLQEERIAKKREEEKEAKRKEEREAERKKQQKEEEKREQKRAARKQKKKDRF